jgi:uncharacterized protein (DUF4415 family)
MTGRKRTRSEEKSYAGFLRELTELDADWQETRLKQRMVPAEWYRLEETAPCRPRKTRITAAFDAEVVRWYRALGHGYQTRMNAVLKAYMLGVMSREIETSASTDFRGDPI